MINPFDKGGLCLNYLNVLCGPVPPAYIDYQRELPVDHYDQIGIQLNDLRRARNSLATSNTAFLAIPGDALYQQVLLKAANNNQMFYSELAVNYVPVVPVVPVMPVVACGVYPYYTV